jgi:hypothetical protein
MQPLHSIEYELTTELAANIHRTLLRWELWRGGRRDVPTFLGAVIFTALILALVLGGWLLPGVGAALLCVAIIFVMGAVLRRWSLSRAATVTALLALQSSDRRVRIDFAEERVRMETEFYRGEGAWTELDEIVLFPGFWALRLSNGGQVVLPVALVSPELETFLRSKAEQVMAPVCRGGR